MEIAQWYGVALVAFASIVVAALHLRAHLPAWLLRHVVYPQIHPLLGGAGDTTRSEAIVVGVLLSGNILCSILDVRSASDLVKRTAQLSIINTVPLFLGGRISPLVNVLKVQYNTYAAAHRWLGRIAAVQAVLHAAVAVTLRRGFRSQSQIAGLVVSQLCTYIAALADD